VTEALQWETKAVRLSGGKDKDINDAFAKMKAGKPTWPTD